MALATPVANVVIAAAFWLIPALLDSACAIACCAVPATWPNFKSVVAIFSLTCEMSVSSLLFTNVIFSLVFASTWLTLWLTLPASWRAWERAYLLVAQPDVASTKHIGTAMVHKNICPDLFIFPPYKPRVTPLRMVVGNLTQSVGRSHLLWIKPPVKPDANGLQRFQNLGIPVSRNLSTGVAALPGESQSDWNELRGYVSGRCVVVPSLDIEFVSLFVNPNRKSHPAITA